MKKLFILLVLPFHFLIAQNNAKINLANQYYQQGDFEKAKLLYTDLVKTPKNVPQILFNYLTLLKSLNEHNVAEKILKTSIRQFPRNIQYKASLVSIYKEVGKEDKLVNYLTQLKKEFKNNTFQYSLFAQYMANEHLYKEAILFFHYSREERKNPTVHALELATIYRMVNDKTAMIEEYLNYATNNPSRLNYVKNLLQNILQEEKELDEFEAILIKKIQDNPQDIKFVELLFWVELQQKNFYGAFIQARAIDKRNKKSGDRAMNVGLIALENNEYDDAEEIFDYIAKQFPDSKNYQVARKYWIETKEKKIKNTYPIKSDDVRELILQYQKLYEEFKPSQTSFHILRNMALLYAFYLHNIDYAADLLNQLVNNRNAGTLLIAKSKLDLGDIYLLNNEPWEATLLYSQVEKTYKNHQLGYESKLRNARLHYFTGNFALAKGHLDILKRNTTREISNDAISLGMLISDNTALDTTDAVMQEFANIELLIFQNKKSEANIRLSQMLDDYKYHAITDEVYWLKSKLELERGNTLIALQYLDTILTTYSYDILVDDAAFKKAEIIERQLKDINEAKNLYQRFLIEYPGSMYAAEARKRFRILRGDFIN